LFLGTDLFWRFCISGLSTMLVILIFLGVVWCLVLLEQNTREERWSATTRLGVAALIGALVGIGALTRYSFGWVIIPAVSFLALFVSRNRLGTVLIALVAFAAVISPWLMRNYSISHTWFGTAGYAVYGDTGHFSDYRLERSLKPDFTQVGLKQLWTKVMTNLRAIIQDDLPKVGGNWVSAFFLAGLLVPFRNISIQRLRWFVVICLPVLIIVQAAGRTALTNDNPVINSENLLVFLAPLLIVFGASFLFILLDQVDLPTRQLRFVAIGGFCAITCLPMLFNFVLPRTKAVAYPPYYPPVIQQTANWMKPDELMMSDIPWAVAWYGQRQCVWTTLNFQEDFYNIYDYQKPILAIYLTPVTMDSRFLTEWIKASDRSWGGFVFETLKRGDLPPYFPLRKMPPIRFLPEQLFLTDHERWPASPQAATASRN
jgi:hypothetical protein